MGFGFFARAGFLLPPNPKYHYILLKFRRYPIATFFSSPPGVKEEGDEKKWQSDNADKKMKPLAFDRALSNTKSKRGMPMF